MEEEKGKEENVSFSKDQRGSWRKKCGKRGEEIASFSKDQKGRSWRKREKEIIVSFPKDKSCRSWRK